jgi:D-alanine-D-alanine ligase
MKIGLTYDLKDDYRHEGFPEEALAEFDSQETIDSIEQALSSLGYEVIRIGHIKNLVDYLSRGSCWDLVFNICEGLVGMGREAQVPALLEAYHIPYTFSDPVVLGLTLQKDLAKRVVRDLGLKTPAFRVVSSKSDLDMFDLPFPVFAKPVAEGTGKGISHHSVIKGRTELDWICQALRQTFNQPVLVETFLTGREFTVGIVGTGSQAKIIGLMEIVLRDQAEPGSYSYQNKKEYQTLVDYRFPEDDQALAAMELALTAWRGLGCRDGGRIDIRCDQQGVPYFLEVNPLAGLHPRDSDLPIIGRHVGMTYVDLIRVIVDSALKRTVGS